MGSYLINFIVYAMAMSGLIFFALFVYKKVMSGSFHSNGTKKLEIEETMSINPRKNLMIVRAGEERFLIASDMDRTSLISKLDSEIHIERSKKSLERFQNIENIVQEPVTELETYMSPMNSIKSETIPAPSPKKKNDVVHLEVITERNPNMRIRRNSNSEYSYTSRNRASNLTQSRRNIKTDASSTMKDMVKKINNL